MGLACFQCKRAAPREYSTVILEHSLLLRNCGESEEKVKDKVLDAAAIYQCCLTCAYLCRTESIEIRPSSPILEFELTRLIWYMKTIFEPVGIAERNKNVEWSREVSLNNCTMCRTAILVGDPFGFSELSLDRYVFRPSSAQIPDPSNLEEVVEAYHKQPLVTLCLACTRVNWNADLERGRLDHEPCDSRNCPVCHGPFNGVWMKEALQA